ncbi:MAG: hypothetical protein K9J12_02945 [Melioribacteraceae bacterium]|nr:hypothetical protein [Melioribacteraceae bacterium]MCF8263336.1 hypothetical protein [Melioribacteraceae bacterium]MCF8414090.1 hypothetical protein [Melioribacteraceae bacterium]MCF8431449.1 hypothetical protein [Melioribacteraceae bacterium]
MGKIEPLDYCRVKKIFDKGFGFLTSLYYAENVFFHFNDVKDPIAKEKLQKMKRGDVYFYFTSKEKDGKRKVDRLWLKLAESDTELIPGFVSRVIYEFRQGRNNPFEVAFVIKELRRSKFLSNEKLISVLNSPNILKTPKIIFSILTEEEQILAEQIEEYNLLLEEKSISPDEWIRNSYKIITRSELPLKR